MITLPVGFDVNLLVSNIFGLVIPFISIALIISFYSLINRLVKKAS